MFENYSAHSILCCQSMEKVVKIGKELYLQIEKVERGKETYRKVNIFKEIESGKQTDRNVERYREQPRTIESGKAR